MRSAVRFVAVRTAGLVVLSVLGSALADLVGDVTDRADANIGLGLLLLGALVLAAVVWARRDGVRAGRSRSGLLALAAGWAVVAVLVAAAGAAWISLAPALSGDGLDTEVLISDLRQLTPFQSCLIGIPALLALLWGRSAAGQPVPPGGTTPRA